ncbi:Odorant receptor, partial [Operophtera brumata]
MKLHEIRAPGTNHIKYRAAFVFNLIWFNLDCLGSLSYLCMGILNGKSFTELSFVAPCLTFSLLGNTKAVYYTLYDTEAYTLIENLIKLEVNRKDCTHLEIVREIKASETNYLNKVLNVLNVMYILLIILYDAGPLVGTAVTYCSTGELKLFLPFLDVYPFDALDLKYWPYAYIHQFWSVCLVLFYVGSVDSFLLTCCTYIRIQFRLVQLDIENLIPGKDITSVQAHDDIHFQGKFKELMSRHQEII